MKGDRVEVVVDTGAGAAQTFEIEATKAGRRVDVSTGRGVVEVAEVTRTITPALPLSVMGCPVAPTGKVEDA